MFKQKFNSKMINLLLANFKKNIFSKKKKNSHKTKKNLLLSTKEIKNYLNNPNSKGYLIIKKISTNKNKIKNLTLYISDLFGDRLDQSDKKNKFLKITPKKNKLKVAKNLNTASLRYHETNFGGSIHSDGPQLQKPPNILIMSCVRNSNRGGYSIVSDTQKIFNHLKRNKPNYLKILRRNFLFERRGFKKSGKSILKRPIFYKKNGTYTFRYLREYIESGYRLSGKKLSKFQFQALNYLDKLLVNKKFISKYKLLSGDLILLNNFRMAHGRSAFKIEKDNTRLFLRTWVK